MVTLVEQGNLLIWVVGALVLFPWMMVGVMVLGTIKEGGKRR